MTNRERKSELKSFVLANLSHVEKWQKKPFTGVRIDITVPTDSHFGFVTYHGLGFSKVRWPDKWDADYGYRMALDKAAMDVVKQLLEDGGDG